jgi:DNA polymerase-3 subunit alpha
VRDSGPFPALKALLEREASGRGEVLLALDLADREVELKLAGGYALTAAARAAIKAVPGVVDVHDV